MRIETPNCIYFNCNTCIVMALEKEILFELHITTHDLSAADVERFIACCVQLEAKPMLIELARGAYAHQPMLSKVLKVQTLTDAVVAARKMCETLRKNNIAVRRLKIEIPSADSHEPVGIGAGFTPYFEWHGKVPYTHPKALQALCLKHTAHLSRNALKNETGTRFVTLREFGTKETFEGRTHQLIQALETEGWPVTKQQSEYCIYDTNVDLDNGWLSLN